MRFQFLKASNSNVNRDCLLVALTVSDAFTIYAAGTKEIVGNEKYTVLISRSQIGVRKTSRGKQLKEFHHIEEGDWNRWIKFRDQHGGLTLVIELKLIRVTFAFLGNSRNDDDAKQLIEMVRLRCTPHLDTSSDN